MVLIASDFRGMLGKNVFAAAAGDVPDVFALIRFVRRALDLVGGCRRPCARVDLVLPVHPVTL